MSVTLIINNVVYIVDNPNMLAGLVKRAAPAMNSQESLYDGKPETMQEPLRILFVEDNDYVRDLTLCLLEDSDREVVACVSAEEAMAEFNREPFDVVITDVSLPGMSGIEFAKRLIKIAPETWFVIASGYQMPSDIDKLGLHVRAMTKPFESEQIDAVLAEVRDARHAARSHHQ